MAGTMMLVRWHGPFDFNTATNEEGPGLYLCWGRHRFGRNPPAPALLYCGISEDRRGVGARIKAHAGEPYDHRENGWWVGRVHLPARPRRRELEAAEWMVVRFTGTARNRKKTVKPPPYDCYLVNEWFHPEGEARHQHRGVAGVVPDVLGWDYENDRVRSADSLSAPTSLLTWDGW